MQFLEDLPDLTQHYNFTIKLYYLFGGMAWQYIADLIETALKSCEFTENRRFIVAELADIYRLVQSKDVEERKRI